MSQAPDPVATPSPTLWSLFSSFVIVSVFGFGGTLAWARRMTVDERKWMSAHEFNEVFALCQFLPGPNVMNFAVAFGSRVRGVPGAFVASLGLCGPSVILMLILGALYARYGDLPELQRFLGGVTCAAAGTDAGHHGPHGAAAVPEEAMGLRRADRGGVGLGRRLQAAAVVGDRHLHSDRRHHRLEEAGI